MAEHARGDQRLAMRQPPQQFDGGDLRDSSNELREGGEYAQVKGIGLKEERKGREVLLAAALRDSLTGAVAEAIAEAPFSSVMLGRGHAAAWWKVCRRGWAHSIISLDMS